MRSNFLLSLVFGIALPLFPVHAAESREQKGYRQDLESMFQTLERDYAYRDQKRLDWPKLKQEALAQATKAQSIQAFIRILERIMDETYDPHNMLNTNLKDSWRPVPHDIWAEQAGTELVIRQVRPDSAAARAGVKPGQVLQKINGVEARVAVHNRLPAHLLLPDPAAQQWAILSAVGGARRTPRVFEVREQGAMKTLTLADENPAAKHDLHWRSLTPDVGWIQIPDFTSEAQVKDFDRALEELKGSKTLILDVRNNTGGDTEFAKPMMGRLIKSRLAYAWMGRVKQGQLVGSSEEFVESRGPWTYSGRVLVLINRFSVSMAEGFAMGLQGMGRAELVGSSTAGLGAAIERYDLPFSKITWQMSREPVYQLSGAPREQLRPDHAVDDRADDDAAMKEALDLAKR